MTIKILHLYHDLMNLYGDYGNVKIIDKHLNDQNIETNIDCKSIDDKINFKDYDLIYIGSGTEKNQLVALEDLKKRKDDLEEYIDNNGFVLLTGNSYELLGGTLNDTKLLGLLNFEVKTLEDRITHDVIYSSSLLDKKVVGFVNKQSEIYNNNHPLFKVEFGIGENKDNVQEGIKYKNVYGTHVIGPIMARNPEFLKYFICELCTSKNKNFAYKDIEYADEETSYNIVLSELTERKEK